MKQNISTDKNLNSLGRKHENKETSTEQAEFLELNGVLHVTGLLTERGDMTGWALSRGGVFLDRNRGGIRTFQSLDSVDSFRKEHGMDGFIVGDV